MLLLFHKTMLMLNEFQAGTIHLRDMSNMTRLRSLKDFQLFLKVLEVYGVGYEDDINHNLNIDRAKVTHA